VLIPKDLVNLNLALLEVAEEILVSVDMQFELQLQLIY